MALFLVDWRPRPDIGGCPGASASFGAAGAVQRYF